MDASTLRELALQISGIDTLAAVSGGSRRDASEERGVSENAPTQEPAGAR